MRLGVLLIALCCVLTLSPLARGAGTTGYDAAFAQRLGADERGMRKFVLVMLKDGPNEPKTEAERRQLFKGHMANINRLAEAGKLVVAGPMAKNERLYQGVFVFNVATIDEARALVATDPAVVTGALAFEMFEWYASAALVDVPNAHKRLMPPGK